MKIRIFLPLFILLSTAAMLLVGCADKAQPYFLIIECDDAVARRAVEVDLVGVTALEKPEWEAYSITKYWEPEDKKRGSAGDKMTREFGTGHPRRYVLSLKDPDVKQVWMAWMGRGVTDLIVIAHLKSVTTDEKGNADPRRKTLPLKVKIVKELYPKAKAFRIFVQDGSVRIDPLDEIPKEAAK
jgi:hypothetical protein